MFAIYNIRTKKFLYGTDYRYRPSFRQRTSTNRMLTYDEFKWADADMQHRKCGKDYRVVELMPVKVKKIYERT